MGTLNTTSGEFEYQWASDVDFDGVRLEVLNSDGDMLFDVRAFSDQSASYPAAAK